MPINTDANISLKNFKFIYTGLICLFLGLTASPTLVAGYHILIFVPTVLLMIAGSRFSLSKSSWALVALVGWGLISTFYNLETLIKPNKSFQELKYYFFGIYSIIALKYFLNFATKKQIKTLLNLLLFAIIVGFFVGIARSKFSFDPVKWVSVPGKYHTRAGGFTNYMRYGYSSALLLVLGFGAWFNYDKLKDYISKKWLLTFLVFNILAVVFSETRGALLVLTVGGSFLLLKYKPLVGKSLLGVGIAAVISIGVYSINQKSTNRYLNINDGSNKIRLSQFYTAYKTIQEKPFFGLGADQFSYNVKALKIKYDIWAKNYASHSHNIFLEHAANYGIPGLIAFILFLAFWFWEMIKLKTDFSWVIASYIVGFTVGGQVELLFDVINSHLIFFLYSFSQLALLNNSQKKIMT